MITPPTGWDDIVATEGSYYDFRVLVELVGGVQLEFTVDDVGGSGFTLERRLFDSWSVGNACAAHLSFTLIDSLDYAPILTEGLPCTFQVRAVGAESSTSWVTLGLFYVDSVTTSGASVSVSAYDELQRLDNESVQFGEAVTLGEYASLLEDQTGISLLADSSLVNELYWQLGEPSATSSTPRTQQALELLSLPVELSEASVRQVIASAAAYAGGNAWIDQSGELRLSKLTDGSYGYNPGIIATYAVNGTEGLNSLVATNVKTGSDEKDMSGPGYGIVANVLDALQFTEYGADDMNTSAVIKLSAFANATDGRLEEQAIRIDGAEVSPLVQVRDEVSYYDANGKAHAFKINGFRLQCASWCVGELSTQVSIGDAPFLFYSYYVYSPVASAGWYDWKFKDVTLYARNESKNFASWFEFESDKSIIVKLLYFAATSNWRYYRLDGQQFTLTFASYYDKSGTRHTNETYTLYAQEQVFLQERNTVPIRFVAQQLPDVDPTKSISATLSWEQSTCQRLEVVRRA